MGQKYVLEIGGPSMYLGCCVESRLLYDTYEEAKAEFDKILQENYTEQDLADEDFVDSYTGLTCGDEDYIDDWMDAENDVYLFIYEVKEAKSKQ